MLGLKRLCGCVRPTKCNGSCVYNHATVYTGERESTSKVKTIVHDLKSIDEREREREGVCLIATSHTLYQFDIRSCLPLRTDYCLLSLLAKIQTLLPACTASEY